MTDARKLKEQASINRRTALKWGGMGLAGFGAAAIMPGRMAFAQDLTDLSFQLSWLKSIQYGGYFAALDNGFFEDQGLDVTFVSGGPNIDPLANVAAGQSQIGDRPIGPILVAKEKGIPIKVIGTVYQKSPFAIMSPADKPITSVEDLEGKVLSTGSSSRPLIEYLLREAGMSPGDVQMVPHSPDPAGLVAGQIDGYLGYSTNQGVMLQSRGFEIHSLNVSDLGVPETTGTIYAREDYLAEHGDKAVDFLAGAVEGWKWALAHPEETATLMVETYGAPGLEFEAQVAEIVASKPLIEAGAAEGGKLLNIDVALFQKIIDTYAAAGLIEGNFSAEELCAPQYIQDALARVA
ncbi:ABC transporter substrate-binding protein [Acuticoccus sp. M5D2P5]|uniref:ABC transporter substrate-binding protein n=1 Tax=Acuticoccus kalidii TaxID=2910977 RepID=UPI001F2F7F12|nr:ABC transporter substrate-binding protein [Acuticoccus kalidii]MCF3932945.1 ABC transporter substrate-binding protein [Acuticoccus kalidii]